MDETMKGVVMDERDIRRTLSRMAQEILESNKSIHDITLAGISERGTMLAKRLHEILMAYEGIDVPVSSIEGGCENMDGKAVVLINDVLHTARDAFGALEALTRACSPSRVQLAALIDRGHHELPVRADFIGRSLPTSKRERVKVSLLEFDGEENVSVWEKRE